MGCKMVSLFSFPSQKYSEADLHIFSDVSELLSPLINKKIISQDQEKLDKTILNIIVSELLPTNITAHI